MKSYLVLKKYYKTQFLNIQLSKFIRTSNINLTKLTKIECAIHSKKIEATHFLYLFLLTQDLPRLRKYYQNSISFFKETVSSGQQKSIAIDIYLKKRFYWKFLYQALFVIFPTQAILEANAFQVTRERIQLFIENMPLTYNTVKLQSVHHYIALLPFSISMIFTNATLFEKISILKTLRFLKIPSYIPSLSEFHKN